MEDAAKSEIILAADPGNIAFVRYRGQWNVSASNPYVPALSPVQPLSTLYRTPENNSPGPWLSQQPPTIGGICLTGSLSSY